MIGDRWWARVLFWLVVAPVAAAVLGVWLRQMSAVCA